MKQLIIFLLFLFSTVALSQIYEYKDARGNTVFSDRPPTTISNTPVRPVKKSAQINTFSLPAISATTAPAQKTQKDATNNQSTAPCDRTGTAQ